MNEETGTVERAMMRCEMNENENAIEILLNDLTATAVVTAPKNETENYQTSFT